MSIGYESAANSMAAHFLKVQLNIEANKDKQSVKADRIYNKKLFKQKQKELTPEKMWELQRKQNHFMFNFYVYIYIFLSDDKMISKKEQRALKKIIKSSKDILSVENKEKIVALSEQDITINDILDFIKLKKIPSSFIESSLKEIRRNLPKDEIYRALYNDLKTNLKDV